MKCSRRLIKRLYLGLFFAPLLLILVLAVALYIPVVQDMATQHVAHYASELLGKEVKIGRLRIGFPLHLEARNIALWEAGQDTLASVGRVELSLNPMPLLRGEVSAPQLTLESLRVNHIDTAVSTRLSLDLPSLQAYALSLSPKGERLYLSGLRAQGGRILYHSSDTTQAEASKPLAWLIDVDDFTLEDTAWDIALPHDSLFLKGELERLHLEAFRGNLQANDFSLAQADLEGGAVHYYRTEGYTPRMELDPQYIKVKHLALKANTLRYTLGGALELAVEEGRGVERSGLELTLLRGAYRMDDKGFALDGLALQTAHSSIYGACAMPWSLLGGDSTAHLQLKAEASIGIPDLKAITGKDLSAFVEHTEGLTSTITPTLAQLTEPISINLTAEGTLQRLKLQEGLIMWEDVFDLTIGGEVLDLYNPKARHGALALELGTHRKANTLLGLLDRSVAQRFNIPSGVVVKGKLQLTKGGQHAYHLSLLDQGAKANIEAEWNDFAKSYQLKANLEGLNLRRYAPHEGLGLVSMDWTQEGQGLDVFSTKTASQIKARLHTIDYQQLSLKDITLDGKLHRGELEFALNSFNSGLNLSLLVDGLLKPKATTASLMLDVQDLDLQALGLSRDIFKTRFTLSGELSTDLEDLYHIKSQSNNLHFALGEDILEPQEIELELKADKEAMRLALLSGDFRLGLKALGRYAEVGKQWSETSTLLARLEQELTREQPMSLRLEQLVASLPELELDLEMGRKNPLTPLLAKRRLATDSLVVGLKLSHEAGLSGRVALQNIRQDTLRIDYASLNISTERLPRASEPRVGRKAKPLPLDSMTVLLMARVDKKAWRRQKAFSGELLLHSSLQGGDASLTVMDGAGQPLHKAQLMANWDGRYYGVKLLDSTLVLAQQSLSINPNNYLQVSKAQKWLFADLKLQGQGATYLALEANATQGQGQEVNLNVNQLPLENYQSLGLKGLGGLLGLSLRYTRPEGEASGAVITGDLGVQRFRYEDKLLGHFAAALFYEPRNNQSHYLTSEISYEGDPVFSLDGIYHTAKAYETSPLTGSLRLNGFPLDMANPFLAQFATSLGGKLSGLLSLGGKLDAPLLSGDVVPQDVKVRLSNFATTLRLDSLPLRLDGQTLAFEHYPIHTLSDAHTPIYLDGRIDLRPTTGYRTNLKVQAHEVTLFDEPQPKADGQILYGKLIAGADLSLTGRADALKLRGGLRLLGGSRFTYVMREDKLDASSGGDQLVRFVDMADTLFVPKPQIEADLGGMDLSLVLEIEPAVHFGVDLTEGGRDYLRMQGGGRLQLTAPPYGDMRLVGRYEMIGGGTMAYSIPIVGTKLFEISKQSYISFDGKPSNPEVNLVATQKVRANAGASAGGYTNFLVSINLKNRIDNINLSFDLTAPEQLAVQNTLVAMTPEERGKQAIGLLATGTFLAAGGGNTFDGALSSLLQNQLNTVAGALLKDTDLSLGVERSDEGGYNNYTYSFSRRFYNDRLRVIIGGKIQTGGASATRDKSFIDNASLEYQLDKAGEKYLQLYRKQVTDNLLEGTYAEMGVGFLLRRKLRHLSDLWRLRPKRTEVAPDTTINKFAPLRLGDPSESAQP